MEEISKREQELAHEYRVINIEKVGDYLFVETNVKSLLIDKDKNVYDIGDYKKAKFIYEMGDDLVAVLGKDRMQDLVNIKTKEVYISHHNSYYSGIFRIDDDYVELMGPDYNKMVFNIRTKKFIKPDVDIPVEYSMKIGPNLFLYENNDYDQRKYLHFVINQDGELIYDCGEYFPYYRNGDLILSLSKNKEIVIVRDVCNDGKRIETIKQNETINSNPLIYTNENNEADAICFVSGKDFLIVDLDMNVIKKYPLDIDYDEVEIQLWGDMSVIIVKKDKKSYCIGLNMKNGVQIKHYGIWIIPVDAANPNVIRGCDPLDDEYSMFTIYDKEGNEYTHHPAKDCYNIHSQKMNLIGFYSVEGVDGCIVYNVDTKEEKIVPWQNPNFKLGPDNDYMDIGFGIRYGETWQDEIIDIFDEDMNVLYEGIIAKDYGIRGQDFMYQLKNNLLLLTIPISNGPSTYYRKVVLDKEKNKLYDSFKGYLSFVGNFLQIIDKVEDKTYYIDSRTGNTIDDMSITMREFALPDTINVDGEEIKLIKRNEDIYSE